MQNADTEEALTERQQQQVYEALEAILANEKFEAAPQMSAFLRYVVEQAAQGNQSRIKAFTVAVDALGKPDTFDPQNDPVVRVLAGRLRSTLAAYNEGHPDAAVVINMNRGSYAPQFAFTAKTSKRAHRDSAFAAPKNGLEQFDSARRDFRSPTTADGETPGNANDALHRLQSSTNTASASDLHDNASFANRATADASQAQTQPFHTRAGRYLTTLPGMMLAGILTAVIANALLSNRTQSGNLSPQQSTASTVASFQTDNLRERPDNPAVFIDAIDRGDQFENNLNTVLSSAVSDVDGINVLRIIDRNQPVNYWPEDYILTIAALQLPDETRINLQLMQALTGKIVHSTSISLNVEAAEKLDNDELERMMDASRSIVSKEGPMFADFNNRVDG